ncbi:MAG: hypothetical protein ACT4QE_00220 [Anaerolineales bacterium]
MARKTLIGLFVLSTLLAGCAAEPPTAGELLAFEAVCDKANDGKRVAVEGYLLLPDEFTDSESVVLRLYQDLVEDSAKIGVTMRFGTEANRIEEVPISYSDDDLKVHTTDNQVVGYDTRVRVSGKVYFPVVDQDFVCGLENPLVEVAE